MEWSRRKKEQKTSNNLHAQKIYSVYREICPLFSYTYTYTCAQSFHLKTHTLSMGMCVHAHTQSISLQLLGSSQRVKKTKTK